MGQLLVFARFWQSQMTQGLKKCQDSLNQVTLFARRDNERGGGGVVFIFCKTDLLRVYFDYIEQ